jgi:glycosyltransferase involved in cell wall biosynthesis
VKVVLRLKQNRPDLRVRVVGQGPARDGTLAALRAANVDVQYDSFVSNVAEAFLSAKLMLLPSKWEPWGLVCNEAMQCGTVPIISPFVGAGNDLVLDGINGRILPLDVEAWATATRKLLNSGDLWAAFSGASRRAAAMRKPDGAAVEFFNMVRCAVGESIEAKR